MNKPIPFIIFALVSLYLKSQKELREEIILKMNTFQTQNLLHLKISENKDTLNTSLATCFRSKRLSVHVANNNYGEV